MPTVKAELGAQHSAGIDKSPSGDLLFFFINLLVRGTTEGGSCARLNGSRASERRKLPVIGVKERMIEIAA